MNTWKIRKQNSPTVDLENVLVVWIDQTRHNITLNHSLIREQSLKSLQFYVGWEVRKLKKESFKLKRLALEV